MTHMMHSSQPIQGKKIKELNDCSVLQCCSSSLLYYQHCERKKISVRWMDFSGAENPVVYTAEILTRSQ